MTKAEQLIERIVVTFVETAGAYLIVIPTTNWSKTVIAGAIGAGLSAVYNIVRQSAPTVPPSPPTVVPPVTPPAPVAVVTPVGQGSDQNTNTAPLISDVTPQNTPPEATPPTDIPVVSE